MRELSSKDFRALFEGSTLPSMKGGDTLAQHRDVTCLELPRRLRTTISLMCTMVYAFKQKSLKGYWEQSWAFPLFMLKIILHPKPSLGWKGIVIPIASPFRWPTATERSRICTQNPWLPLFVFFSLWLEWNTSSSASLCWAKFLHLFF